MTKQISTKNKADFAVVFMAALLESLLQKKVITPAEKAGIKFFSVGE